MKYEQSCKPNVPEEILDEHEHSKVKERRRNWKGDWEGNVQEEEP